MLYFSYLQSLIHVDNIFEEINYHYSVSQRVENSLSNTCIYSLVKFP